MDAVVGRDWPAGVTRIPYWVYADPDVLALEQKRLFEGPVWNFLCLEIDLPNVGDYRTTFVGSHARRRGARRGRRARRVREPLRASRRADLPGRLRLGEGLPVRLSLLALRSARQPALDRVRRGVNGQGGMPADFDMTQHGPRKLRVTTFCGMVFGTLSPDAPRFEDWLGPEDRRPRPPRAAATASWRSSAASPRRCRTTGSSISRTCATPTTPACCTCSSPRSASPA